MKSHKDLDVWCLSMDFVEKIYHISSDFPKEEMYGLTSQMRRAAVSIPSNIAEGAGRQGHKEFMQFLYVALGSLLEVDTQIMLANRLGYIHDIETMESDINRLKKMLNGLIAHLKGRNT